MVREIVALSQLRRRLRGSRQQIAEYQNARRGRTTRSLVRSGYDGIDWQRVGDAY